MARARAVVFDLDGTLVDSRADIVHAVNHVLEQHGHAALPSMTIAAYVGDGARTLIARCLQRAPDDAEVGDLLEDFLGYYTEHATLQTTLMPGASDVLAELSDLPLCCLTNKPRTTTDVVLTKLGLARHFTAVVAGGDLARIKPDPDPLQHLAAELGLAAEELVMIGDGHQDVDCGRAAGARTIAVTGGFGSTASLERAGPDALVSRLEDVVPLVRRWQRSGD